jgi:pentachlorophenol monooxygenase
MTALPRETEVLVVGAGPTGLSLAIALKRHGIDCVVVDKLDAPLPWSRALGLHARTLEIFQALGVLDAVRARSVLQQKVTVRNEQGPLVELDLTGSEAAGARVLSCPQSEVEACLEQRLRELGGRVVRATELLDFRQDTDGVRPRLRDGAGEHELDSRMLVGCDGAHSRVREQLGLRFDGVRQSDHFLLADLDIDWDLDPYSSHGFLLARGALIALPMPRGWRLVMNQRDTEVSADEEVTLEPFRVRLERAFGEAPELGEPWWLSRFSIHRRLASHYRRNMAFIAGDACHVQSPLGAQGMNTGIADAFNLGWKMALYLQGHGDGSLLDTYERERRPVARSMLNTVDFLSRASFARNPLLRRPRDWILKWLGGQAWFRRRLVRRFSQLDVNYRTVASSLNLPPGFLKSPGPCPGDRVPDVKLVHPDGSYSQHLQALLRDPRHHLLVWLPDDSAHRARVSAYALADRLWLDYGERVAMTVITPAPLEPELTDLREFNVSVLIDRDGDFRRRFGEQNSLWMMRPDGHLAWRGRLREGDRLLQDMERFFRRV